MNDNRIKQISTEMSVAWGLICATFFIIDLCYWHSGIICPSTSGAFQFLSPAGKTVFIVVFFSNSLTFIFSEMIVIFFKLGALKSFIIPILILLFVAFQIVLYWNLGIFIGRFIVWMKHLIRKTEPDKSLEPK
jgi:hypothetical protein